MSILIEVWVVLTSDSSSSSLDSGYFAYGGSTVILVLPPSAKVEWDADLLENSAAGLETMVRVGERIGISNA